MRGKIVETREVITAASQHIRNLSGHVFDVLTVTKPVSQEAASNLAKVISKLSPLLGNMIEFNIVEYLNNQVEFDGIGNWIRQDPGFPDTIFQGVEPTPGFEIKAWFPLATEITARFKDSQNHFLHDQTYVAMLAWLPEKLIYGKPRIVNVCIVSGLSVAEARDDHYHNPPDYLVIEPEDTRARTRNLQQTNTNGYKFQGTGHELAQAGKVVRDWGANARKYDVGPDYQNQLRDLMSRFKYRLDTNFAKMDRIAHAEIERFKTLVYETQFQGMKIGEWNRLLNRGDKIAIQQALTKHLGITKGDADELLL